MLKFTRVLTVAMALAIAAGLIGCGTTAVEEKPAAPAASGESVAPADGVVATYEKKGYQYLSAEDTKNAIEAGEDLVILDTIPADDFAAGHLPGAIETNAWPADTPELTAKLDAAIPALEANDDPILVVCQAGGGGATNTIDHLVGKGFDASRFLILEGGAKGWPFQDLLVR